MGFVSRNTKTEEIIKLAIMMQNSYKGISIKDIAKNFECSTRTAERMKALILDLFTDKIEEVPTPNRTKRWRFKKGGINFLISFDKNDIMMLEDLQKKELPKDISSKLSDLIGKIKALSSNKKVIMNEQNITSIMEEEGYLVRNQNLNKTNSKYLELIRKAILSSKKIEFLYGSNIAETRNIKVNPYGIKISDKYFLVAYNEEIDGIRQFSFDKIFNLKVLKENFERKENFNLGKYPKNTISKESKLKKIILEFDKKEKEYVLDSLFSPEQKFQFLDNGNIRVTYYSEISNEICLELIKWGDNLQVIEPEELKETYKSFLKKILNKL